MLGVRVHRWAASIAISRILEKSRLTNDKGGFLALDCISGVDGCESLEDLATFVDHFVLDFTFPATSGKLQDTAELDLRLLAHKRLYACAHKLLGLLVE